MGVVLPQGFRHESQLDRRGHWGFAREAAGVPPLDGLDHVCVLARRFVRCIPLISMWQISLL